MFVGLRITCVSYVKEREKTGFLEHSGIYIFKNTLRRRSYFWDMSLIDGDLFIVSQEHVFTLEAVGTSEERGRWSRFYH